MAPIIVGDSEPWCQVYFDSYSHLVSQAAVDYLRKDCNCKNYAIFNSKNRICLLFKLPIFQEKIFLDWLRDNRSIANLIIKPLKQGLKLNDLQELYEAKRWSLRGYDSKTVAHILDRMDKKNEGWGLAMSDSREHGFMYFNCFSKAEEDFVPCYTPKNKPENVFKLHILSLNK